MIDWNPDNDPAVQQDSARQTQRIALILVADIKDQFGHRYRMRVRNLSLTGVGGVMQDHFRLAPDQKVVVAFGEYTEIEATIVRVSEMNVGLRFDEVVDLDRIRSSRVSAPPKFEPLTMHKVETPKWMIERAKRGV